MTSPLSIEKLDDVSFRKHNKPDTKALSLTSSGSVGVNYMPFARMHVVMKHTVLTAP